MDRQTDGRTTDRQQMMIRTSAMNRARQTMTPAMMPTSRPECSTSVGFVLGANHSTWQQQ